MFTPRTNTLCVFQNRLCQLSRHLAITMATGNDLLELENSFESKLRIPGARVGSSQAPDTAWEDISKESKLSLAIKVLEKPFMYVRKFLELFTNVLWNRASQLTVTFEGEDIDNSRFFLATFGTEEDLSNVLARSPWTVGGHLVVLQKYDPLKKVAEHGFDSALVWLQLHGLPTHVAKNRNIVMSLAEKAGLPQEKTLVFLQEYPKIKVLLNPYEQLTCGSFLKRPNQRDIPVLFKYKKAGVICYRCAFLGHKEKACKNSSFLNGSPSAFSFLEGATNSEFVSAHKRSSGNGKSLEPGTVRVDPGKVSPIRPKNLLPELEASLVGTGGKITEIDREQGIMPNMCKIEITQDMEKEARVKESSNFENSFHRAEQPANPVVERFFPCQQVRTGNPCRTEKEHADMFGQTYVFRASEDVSLHITPYLIKKTRKTKGPGPMWQGVPVGTESMRKRNITVQKEISCASQIASPDSSLYDPSEASEFTESYSSKKKLLGWYGDFNGFTEEEEESEGTDPEEEIKKETLTKRKWLYPKGKEVQTSQQLPVWKRLKPGPSASV